MTVNQEQIDFWNGPAALRWVSEQDRLDAVLAPLDEAGLAAAAPREGERAIDVGCGCGASTLAIAKRVGPKGHVLGVDISARMLARARERAAGMPWVSFVERDASVHRFSGDADLVYSRFGSMFFADPVAAFANLRSGLRAGGRLYLVCWRAIEDNPWYYVPLRTAERYLPPLPPSEPGTPGPFAYAKEDRLKSILEGAGFSNVTLDRQDRMLCLSSKGVDEAVEYATLAGPVARMIAEGDPAVVPQVRTALAEVLAGHLRDGRVELPSSVWIASARK
jgi:SAM-dependent methyltransferase